MSFFSFHYRTRRQDAYGGSLSSEPRSRWSKPLRKHSQSIMVTLLLLVTILHGADGRFLQTLSTGNWTEAKLACSRAGGRLPFPGDDVDDNNATAEHLLTNDVTSAWIDVHSNVTPWHIKGVPIYDQGCHGAGILQNRTYVNVELWDSCRPWCTGRGYHFAGYRRSGSSATCVCPDYIAPLARLRDSDCREGNNSGYRVVTTSKLSSDPVANLPWTARSGSIGGMCALTVTVVSGSNLVLRLEDDNCYKPHHALCCVQDTVSKFPVYTWFEAHYKCSVLGGKIVAQRGVCGHSDTYPADYSTTRFWSEVNAWVWYINDVITPEHRFTNWSRGEPSLASGTCVVVTQEGAWESAFCDEVRTVVCETVETTPTTPLSTSSQLTSLQTETISSQPTDSVTSGDVSTTQGQHAPGNTSGIAGADAGAVVGALVVLALVSAVIWVLMRRKRQTDRGSQTHLGIPRYSKDNDDVIISRTEIGPHGTTIRENSMNGWSGNNTETSAETNAAYDIDGGDVALGNTTDTSNDTQVYSSFEQSTQVSTTEPHLYASVNQPIQRPGDYPRVYATFDQQNATIC